MAHGGGHWELDEGHQVLHITSLPVIVKPELTVLLIYHYSINLQAQYTSAHSSCVPGNPTVHTPLML